MRTCTDWDVLQVTRIAAAMAAKGLSKDPREFLGESWQAAARSKTQQHDATLAIHAAKLSCWEARRKFRTRGRQRLPREEAFTDLDYTTRTRLFASLYAREPAPSIDERLLTLWQETRPHREGMHPRARLYLYLFTVERWTFSQIADAVGEHRLAVSRLMREAVPAACRGAFSRLGVRPRLPH